MRKQRFSIFGSKFYPFAFRKKFFQFFQSTRRQGPHSSQVTKKRKQQVLISNSAPPAELIGKKRHQTQSRRRERQEPPALPHRRSGTCLCRTAAPPPEPPALPAAGCHLAALPPPPAAPRTNSLAPSLSPLAVAVQVLALARAYSPTTASSRPRTGSELTRRHDGRRGLARRHALLRDPHSRGPRRRHECRSRFCGGHAIWRRVRRDPACRAAGLNAAPQSFGNSKVTGNISCIVGKRSAVARRVPNLPSEIGVQSAATLLPSGLLPEGTCRFCKSLMLLRFSGDLRPLHVASSRLAAARSSFAP